MNFCCCSRGWGSIFSVVFLPEINLHPPNLCLRFNSPSLCNEDATYDRGRYNPAPLSAAPCFDFPLPTSYILALLPLTHSTTHCNLAASPYSPLEASLAEINNDLFVTKFNGYFSVLVLPNSSAGFDMVDHSLALESFSSLVSMTTTSPGFPPLWALIFSLFPMCFLLLSSRKISDHSVSILNSILFNSLFLFLN